MKLELVVEVVLEPQHDLLARARGGGQALVAGAEVGLDLLGRAPAASGQEGGAGGAQLGGVLGPRAAAPRGARRARPRPRPPRPPPRSAIRPNLRW